jgi:hypothetical protein
VGAYGIERSLLRWHAWRAHDGSRCCALETCGRSAGGVSDGQKVHRVDRPNVEWGQEAITILAEPAGPHTLIVSTLHPAGPRGQHVLRVGPIGPRGARHRARVEAERAVTEGEAARGTNSVAANRNAVARFGEAASRWRALGDPYGQSIALYGQAIAHQFLGEHEHSVRNLERMLVVLRRAGDDTLREQGAIRRTGELQ